MRNKQLAYKNLFVATLLVFDPSAANGVNRLQKIAFVMTRGVIVKNTEFWLGQIETY